MLPPLKRYTFARDGHPALDHWDRKAWLFWPHAMVGMSEVAQTLEERVAQLGVERRVGARIPEFSAVGPLVARSNMLANQIGLMAVDDSERYGLRKIAMARCEALAARAYAATVRRFRSLGRRPARLSRG